MPRGPPRTQEATFPGLARRRFLPPRALPPLQTPSDSACLTPLLLPSGPGWGRGSAGCAGAVGSAGTLRPDRYSAHWRGGGGSGSRLPPRRVRSRPKRGNWRQDFPGGDPQRTPLARGFPTESCWSRRPVSPGAPAAWPLAHSPRWLTNPRLEFKIPAASLALHPLPRLFFVFCFKLSLRLNYIDPKLLSRMSLQRDLTRIPSASRRYPRGSPAPRPRETPRGGAGGLKSAAGGAGRSCLPRGGAPGLASALRLLPSGQLPGESVEQRQAGDGDWETLGERRRGGGGGESAGAEAGRGRWRQEPPERSERPRVQEALKPRQRREPPGPGRRLGWEVGGGAAAAGGVAGLSPFVLARSPWPPTPLLSRGGGSSRPRQSGSAPGAGGGGGSVPAAGSGGRWRSSGWLTSTRKPRTRASGSACFSSSPASCRSLSSVSAGSVPRCRICKPRRPTARCCRCSRSARCSSAPSPVAPIAGAPRSTPASRST